MPFVQNSFLYQFTLGYFWSMKLYCITAALMLFSIFSKAQEKWDLKRCVEYGMQNNIAVKQTTLQKGFADIQLKQDLQSQYPSLNLGNSYGMSFGRRENPTTGIFEDQRFFNTGLNMQSSVSIFNWYSKKNIIAADRYEVLASTALVEKQKNDIALLIAVNYLQVLLSMQQAEIVKLKFEQSQASLSNTRKLVTAGTLPELNATEIEAQVAADSSSYITAKGNIIQNQLALKNLLNLDPAQPFEVEAPAVERIPLEDIATLQPEIVYSLALANMPQQQYNSYKYLAGQKQKKAAWAAMKPSVNAFAGLGTNYVYFRNPIPELVATGGFDTTVLTVNTGTNIYNVLQPEIIRTGRSSGYFIPNAFFKQFGDNFGQNIGVSVSIPIFNGGALRSQYARSQLNLQTLELIKEQDNMKLKQYIYRAFNDAVVAKEKFNAGKKTLEAAEKSNGFAQKRYAVGMLSTLELITNQNNLFRAKLENSLNQFDYVFKMKVLEFYKGQGLKL